MVAHTAKGRRVRQYIPHCALAPNAVVLFTITLVNLRVPALQNEARETVESYQ